MTVVVRRAVGADWASSRAIRLQALLEAPLAFASTYAREAAFSDDRWQERITTSAQFLAETADGEVVGTATGFTDPGDVDTVHLVAMFVAESARRQGVGELLVAAVVAQARSDGARQVQLHVVESNCIAERLYARCGFVRTGATMRLPHSPGLVEHEMELSLVPPVGAAN